MDLVDELRKERNAQTVSLTLFLEEYKKDATNICYGFVEGKDDPSYYRNAIKSRIDKDCLILLYPSNGKKHVKYVYDELHKRNISQQRIVYFMDRDLSDLILDDNIIEDSNVYITDNYSIENDIINSNTLKPVMQDLLGFAMVSQTDIQKVQSLYEQQECAFCNKMLPIMSNIVMWKRNNIIPANYKNLKIKNIFKISNGKLIQLQTDSKVIEEFYKTSQVNYAIFNPKEVEDIQKEISAKSLTRQILRGKYLVSFFIMFCNSLHLEHEQIGIARSNKGRLLTDNDMMETIALRCLTPPSLTKFIDEIISPNIRTII